MQPVSTFQWRYTVVAVGLSLVMVAAHGQVAFSQNNAARNAAGYMILQNNRTQQELRETKQELREIKEGLGIESTSSGGSAPSPAAIAASVALLAVVGVITLWAISQAAACETYRKAGNFQKYKQAYGFRAMFVAFVALFAPVFGTLFVAALMRDRIQHASADAIQSTAQFSVLAFIAWTVVICVFGKWYVNESRLRRLFEAVHPIAAVSATSSANPHRSFVRLPSGEIKGPGEKANIRVLAKQGRYPPGTQWSDSANGPWETLVEEAAITPSLRLWIRTPDGRSGGPYTRDQIKKAIATGKLAANAQAASTPSGPWRSIGSFSG
jgi:hypothetical protein